MTRESGVAELLELEFQPPHTAPACGFGLAAAGKVPCASAYTWGGGHYAPTLISGHKSPWGSGPPWLPK